MTARAPTTAAMAANAGTQFTPSVEEYSPLPYAPPASPPKRHFSVSKIRATSGEGIGPERQRSVQQQLVDAYVHFGGWVCSGR